MEISRLVGLFVGLVFLASGARADEVVFLREPRPFVDPYRDGLVFTLWNPAISDERIAELLARLPATGAKHIEIPIWGCQSTPTSSDVGSCEVISRAFMMRIAREAVRQGRKITLLPIVLTPGSVWRGYFDPTDVDAWFESYTKWLESVARDAIELGSTELVVGSEFKPIYRHTEHWRRLLRHMRGVFPGPLIVTANWDEFDYGFWDEADAIGVSAYFPLSVVPNPTQEMLDRGWRGHREKLKKIADKWKRPLHMTEVGYSSSSTTAAMPWTIGEGAVPDAPLQARCFMAFAKTWVDQPWMVRATVWSTGDPAGDHSMSGDPLGKPAEAILRAFFQARASH